MTVSFTWLYTNCFKLMGTFYEAGVTVCSCILLESFGRAPSFWRMISSGMLHCAALVRTDIRETRIGELGTTLAVTSNRITLGRNTIHRISCSVLWLLVTGNVPRSLILVTLTMEATHSSKSAGATQRNISEYGILQKLAILANYCKEDTTADDCKEDTTADCNTCYINCPH
jgi:hypothetical protein